MPPQERSGLGIGVIEEYIQRQCTTDFYGGLEQWRSVRVADSPPACPAVR